MCLSCSYLLLLRLLLLVAGESETPRVTSTKQSGLFEIFNDDEIVFRVGSTPKSFKSEARAVMAKSGQYLCRYYDDG